VLRVGAIPFIPHLNYDLRITKSGMKGCVGVGGELLVAGHWSLVRSVGVGVSEEWGVGSKIFLSPFLLNHPTKNPNSYFYLSFKNFLVE